MSNVLPIAASGITAAMLRLESSAVQIANAGSNGASSYGPDLRQNLQKQTVKTAAAKAAPPPS